MQQNITGLIRVYPYIDGVKKIKHIEIIPIRTLSAWHKGRIAAHLLALSVEDRYLRFGYKASDAQIQNYIDALDFERDDFYGIFNRNLDLLAVAHIAFTNGLDQQRHAEFGVSVNKEARHRGYGSRLFERAALRSRNEGVAIMHINALSQNSAMLKIARKAGAMVENFGSDTEAHLKLPTATLSSRLSEMMESHMAHIDYGIKFHAKNLHKWWSILQGH
ncbi:MAG TPA: GNAT family N-acetyltransferase [Burkholderiaceae bacterium]|nr:GNAT family N-acetyltransferase [Burkholderiaceae bacterium]